MAELDTPTALRRKLTAPANPLDSAGMSPAKALRVAVARAFEDAAELEVAVSSFKETKETLAQISQSLEKPHLIFSLKGPGAAVGLGLWNLQAVAGLIEQLITGRVVPSEAENRIPTATDAAIIRNVQNLILQKFDKELAQLSKAPPVSGFRCAGVFEDGRAVLMALEDLEYRSYQLTLDFHHGAKTAEIRLIFPWERAGASPEQANQGAAWATAWQESVHATKAAVSAVLHRIRLPLADITQMQVGGMVPIPIQAIGKVVLQGSDGQAVALGRLGQSEGHRAVRITGTVSTSQASPEQAPFSAPDMVATDAAVLNMPNPVPLDPVLPSPELEMDAANAEDADGVPGT